jgi:glycosyltransferase involved in cell wall biosynthesis
VPELPPEPNADSSPDPGPDPRPEATRKRLLFIKSRRASFIELDQQLLTERYDVTAIYQPGHYANPLNTLRAVRGADVIVGWWASWHTILPFTLAWLLRKPSLLIVGGFDTAAEPEYGYGFQLGGPRKYLSRFTMRRARTLMTNSEYSRREVERNCGIPSDRVTVVYHGIPDEAPPATEKQQLALTVGIVDATNLERKGLRPFAQAAALLPDVEFVLAGRLADDAGEQLKANAPKNLRITGWIEDEELQNLYARAAVYVQPSKHEGFGVSVAEAMLARCVPVVTTAGALPEVVGDAGVILADPQPATVAAGIREALTRTPGDAARARVLERFSVEQRRQGLRRLIDALLS